MSPQPLGWFWNLSCLSNSCFLTLSGHLVYVFEHTGKLIRCYTTNREYSGECSQLVQQQWYEKEKEPSKEVNENYGKKYSCSNHFLRNYPLLLKKLPEVISWLGKSLYHSSDILQQCFLFLGMQSTDQKAEVVFSDLWNHHLWSRRKLQCLYHWVV